MRFKRVIFVCICLPIFLLANDINSSVKLQTNALYEAFSNATISGNLRMNSFLWDWKSENALDRVDHKAFAIGGSLLYKTAPIEGLSALAGFYYSKSPFSSLREDSSDVGIVKSGNGTFSRYDVSTSGDWSMAVLAQAYLQYTHSKTSIKLGRQTFTSALTAANDTKMIPNTFKGVSAESKELKDTTLKFAYFTAQKLRDHTTFHDVLTYGDGSASPYASWNNNDDSGAHKGLSYANFVAAGKDPNNKLVIAEMINRSVDKIELGVTYTAVPEVLSSVVAHINYQFDLTNGYSLLPAVRYMCQMDDGGGKIGGASLNGDLAGLSGAHSGYKDASSLDSAIYMGRLVLTDGIFRAMIAYSEVEDAADIVAPWRGFPTVRYTRAMGQLNWRANTKTTMAQFFYDFKNFDALRGLSIMSRYAIMDNDELKQGSGVQSDMNVVHIDVMEQLTKKLSAKFRIGLVDAQAREDGIDKDSYNEYRFEVNYIF